jgi:hypothetical protein
VAERLHHFDATRGDVYVFQHVSSLDNLLYRRGIVVLRFPGLVDRQLLDQQFIPLTSVSLHVGSLTLAQVPGGMRRVPSSQRMG